MSEKVKNVRKRFIIACDLEGVNNVVGEPYKGLYRGCDEWEIARRQAALEINSAAGALFEGGALEIALWDNHGGGGNIDPANLDPRIQLLDPDMEKPRFYFAGDYDAVLYFGYHAMEGTLGGVLAHTMNSAQNQYYKLNGKYIGEVDMDAYIAASYGVPSVLFVGGDIACSQARRAVPSIHTVVTKREISRNAAEFRDNGELFSEIATASVLAAKDETPLTNLKFPAVIEKSFKRVEDAELYLKRLLSFGISSKHPECDVLGNDAHTVVSVVNDIDEFRLCI